jgi:hypothetical protein
MSRVRKSALIGVLSAAHIVFPAPYRLRFFADVEHIGGFELHAVSRLHRLDAAFQKFVCSE